LRSYAKKSKNYKKNWLRQNKLLKDAEENLQINKESTKIVPDLLKKAKNDV
jgi:hypothetical protein